MTDLMIVTPDKSVDATIDDEDDIRCELFLSAREAGVSCYPVPELEAEEFQG